jgi:hypothetical protein
MFPTVGNTFARSQRKSHSLSSCFAWTLAILILLCLGLSMIWLFVIGPSIHNMAKTELNLSLDHAEANIHPPLLFISGIVIPVSEHTINEMIVTNLSPSDAIKNPVTHITPNNIYINFQLYGFPCVITAVPQVTNGHLGVNNVAIEGIMSFIISPDDITTLLDTHLTHAQELFQHSVTNVQLQNQEMDLTFQ